MDAMNIDDFLGSLRSEDALTFPVATAAGREAERLFAAAGLENNWSLIALARQLVTQGKPSVALQAVVTAVRSEGGDEAVLQTLSRAQGLYINRAQADAAVDELASLFAECAIAEARPSMPAGIPPAAEQMDSNGCIALLRDVSDPSILAESGRVQIMLDAFSDGSSFICLRCGGLVSCCRMDEHYQYWCASA